MKSTRRQFLQTSASATLALTQTFAGESQRNSAANQPLNAFAIARTHSIVAELPTPNFFEGMLLGNGDVGVCVVVRPDALGLHIGKNDCWDIRMSEEVQEHVLPFPELLKLWQRASDEAKRLGKPDMLFLESNVDFLRQYSRETELAYLRPWPRPWPCGTIWLHWDPRWVQPRIHALDPSCGLFTLDLNCTPPAKTSRTVTIACFVDWATGAISASTDSAVPISSVSYYPRVDEGQHQSGEPDSHKSAPNALPAPELEVKPGIGFATFSCFQYFPAIGPTEKAPTPPKSDKDRNFALQARLGGNWLVAAGQPPNVASFTAGMEQPLGLYIKVTTPRDLLLARLESDAGLSGKPNPWISIPQDHSFSMQDLDTRSQARTEIERLARIPHPQLQGESETRWQEFWARSGVCLEDKELERIWYHNQYFLACCLRPGRTAPGLFGNWVSGDLGTAWHGDYHLDYNCQQLYWGVFSSNHVEQHLPYVELCQNLLAMCEKFARDKFDLPGACFPLTAVPVPSQSIFIPSPPWAYQVSNTLWTVQSLWWHFLYTQDREYLQRVYPILRAGARFLAAYAKKGDDGRFHVVPTVSPENWGFTVDFRLNQDCILDLALSRFLLDAVIEASTIVGTDPEERTRWREIRTDLALYPKGQSSYGDVWLDVSGAPLETVYNVPVTLAPVFPAEQVGIGIGPDQLELARRTARTVRLEGGNDLVFQPLIRARLGILDLSWFKREVRYCRLPNGVANDRVRQTVGRYDDSTDFDFMMRMGIWTENFSLPAVLNECMLQSYTGTIRLFPNTENLGAAEFQNLRAAGAFLVTAAYDGKTVTRLSILSEKGNTARVAQPWKAKVKITRLSDTAAIAARMEDGTVVFDTQPGERYQIERES